MATGKQETNRETGNSQVTIEQAETMLEIDNQKYTVTKQKQNSMCPGKNQT